MTSNQKNGFGRLHKKYYCQQRACTIAGEVQVGLNIFMVGLRPHFFQTGNLGAFNYLYQVGQVVALNPLLHKPANRYLQAYRTDTDRRNDRKLNEEIHG